MKFYASLVMASAVTLCPAQIVSVVSTPCRFHAPTWPSLNVMCNGWVLMSSTIDGGLDPGVIGHRNNTTYSATVNAAAFWIKWFAKYTAWASGGSTVAYGVATKSSNLGIVMLAPQDKATAIISLIGTANAQLDLSNPDSAGFLRGDLLVEIDAGANGLPIQKAMSVEVKGETRNGQIGKIDFFGVQIDVPDVKGGFIDRDTAIPLNQFYILRPTDGALTMNIGIKAKSRFHVAGGFWPWDDAAGRAKGEGEIDPLSFIEVY